MDKNEDIWTAADRGERDIQNIAGFNFNNKPNYGKSTLNTPTSSVKLNLCSIIYKCLTNF